jgi:predicted phosphodiesterase
MKVMCIGDIHLSDNPPAWCTDDYLEDLFVILEHSVDKAYALGVDAVVWAGDVFHHKAPSRNSHAMVQRAIALIASYHCPVYIVPGNHDLANSRKESIFTTQPLGTLLRAGAELLDGWADGFPLYGVPWLGKFTDESVSEALRSYREDGEVEDALVVAHAPIFPPGQENPFECYKAVDWAAAMGNTGSCYYGHVHEAHRVYEAGGVTFANMGAISRGSLSEADRDRSIKVCVWEQGWNGFTEVDLPYRPADEVFRVMEARAVKDAQGRLEDFLSAVGEVRLEISGPESVVEYVNGMDVDDDVRQMVVELVREAADGH